MSYVKKFAGYRIHAKVKGDAIRMEVETAEGVKPYCYASGLVYAPTFYERWFGITWCDKLELMEKQLFKEVLDEENKDKNPVLQAEIDKFLNN